MVESASALPVIVGVELFVIAEDVAKEVGASGAVVSIVIEIEEDFWDKLPAESVEVALTEYWPSSSVADVIVKAPFLLAVVLAELVTVDPL